ncbi:MAG: hypothetical protein GPJ52_02835 [Candidatus Heimdallarchaeota archaeon]|nr:hypothetical protein [Candidatus Heimdallarchaeota archaeon]
MSEDKPILEMFNNMLIDYKEKLPLIFDGRIRELLKLDKNIDMESRGTRAAHGFRFNLDKITQSIRHLSIKKGRAEARDRSESRYNSALRNMIRDSDSMNRISKNSDIYINSDGSASLIITDWSSLTEQDKDSLELYAAINGLDIRRTE